jgi:heat shock protein HslJ
MRLSLVCLPLLLAACAASPSAKSGLAGTQWQLRSIQSMDDAQGTTKIADPAHYTLSFGKDGRASMRFDCNRGSGSWEAEASSADSGILRFGAIAVTRAMCAPGSLDSRVARDLPYSRHYLRKDGKLYVTLLADGGIYEWEPMATEQP